MSWAEQREQIDKLQITHAIGKSFYWLRSKYVVKKYVPGEKIDGFTMSSPSVIVESVTSGKIYKFSLNDLIEIPGLLVPAPFYISLKDYKKKLEENK